MEDSGVRFLPPSDLILSGDVITEILLRLPPNSISRFKSVSKGWRRLISDPSFIPAYCSRKDEPVLAGFFANNVCVGRGHTSRPPTFVPSSIETDKLIQRIPCCYCYASSNGIVLLASSTSNFCVWSPVTGESFSIPDPCASLHNSVNSIGFVCSASSEPSLSYKLVVVSKIVQAEGGEAPMALPARADVAVWKQYGYDLGRLFETDTLRVMTYSSDTEKWTTSTLLLPMPTLFQTQSAVGVVADGIIYWLVFGGGDGFIFGYDPVAEVIESIPLPPACLSDCSLQLGFDGFLSLCEKNGSKISIWVLSHGKTWSLEYSLRFDFLDGRQFQIICLCKDQRAIYLCMEGEIVWLSVETGRAAMCGDVGYARGIDIVPLMLPPWPLPLPKIDRLRLMLKIRVNSYYLYEMRSWYP